MKRFRYLFGPRGEQGSVAPVVALGLVALVGAMALGIDLGQLQVVRNELQNVADSAALAAAKKLIQEDKDNPGSGVAKVYCADAIQAAKDYVNKNYSLGVAEPLTITDADVTIGLWDLSARQFTRTGCSVNPVEVNAVQVTVRRDGGSNDKVSTYFGSALGAGTRDVDPETGIESGPAKMTVAASAVAMLGLAGTSSVDVPLAVPAEYLPGGGIASNGVPRILDKLAPTPAYAADPQTYRWKDLGGTSLATNRAQMVVAESAQLSLSWLQYYLKGADISGGKRFPQKKVGDKLYGISEYKWGSNIKSNFTILKNRWTAKKGANGKWRVTVPVFKTTPVTASLPQDSWFKLASRLLPGVTQAHACAAYTSPAIYTQGFATVDIVTVNVPSCNTSTDQVTDSNSCRNTCYMDIEVPLTQNTVSSDKGSDPTPYQKDYKDMNTTATEVGVFASTPRIVQ